MDKNLVLMVLSKFRYLSQYILDNQEEVIKDILSKAKTRYMVFPCDVIDLRSFLKERTIKGNYPIPVFSKFFAEKYLKEYSLFLELDSDKIAMNFEKVGGLQLNYCEEIDICNIIRVIVNEPAARGSFNVVKSIIDEFGVGVECLLSSSVPGLSQQDAKFSSKSEMKIAQSVQSELPITDREERIFNFLREVKNKHNLNIQMRVVGGWVRDKLLGKDSDDIDISIDMPGYDFAKLVSSMSVQYGMSDDSKAYNVSLDKNADPLSKVSDNNLMVGAVYLLGQKIEFVPMRTESYPDPNSRKPKITTTNDPREDVKRRDLTINALYYNIETGKVDDFVGGKQDLGLDGSNRIVLRTPDDPKKTYEEDPLRLLRVLRFHSRYPNSIIDPSIKQAMADPSVQDAYLKKVAPTRAGPELMKMMIGPDPTSSLKLLFETGLYRNVFDVPEMKDINPDGISMDQKSPYHKYTLLDHTLKVVYNLNKIMKDNGESDEDRGLMNLAAVFHDFGKMKNSVAKLHPNPKMPGHTSYHEHEVSSEEMAESILKSIGVPKEKRVFVNAVIRTHMYPHDSHKWDTNKIWKQPGEFIEKMRIKGKGGRDNIWKYVFYHAQADAMSSNPDTYNPDDLKKGQEWFSKYYSNPAIEFTRTNGTVIDGNVFEELRQNIEQLKNVRIKKNIIKYAMYFILQQQYTGKIDMSFASMPPGPERENAMRKSMEQGKNKANSWMLNSYTNYLDTTPIQENNIISGNWFKRMKISQLFSEVEENNWDKDPEVIKGPSEARPKYKVGDKIRDRRKGMVNPQEYGEVKSIRGNKIKIVWNPADKEKRKEEIYDMVEDAALLSFLVTEV